MDWFEWFLRDPIWYSIIIFCGLIGIGILFTITPIINKLLNKSNNDNDGCD